MYTNTQTIYPLKKSAIIKLLTFIHVLAIIFLINPEEVSADFKSTYNYKDWQNVRVDSEPAIPLTAEEIRNMFKMVNKLDSVYMKPGVAESLLEASAKYGINPYIMLNMSIVESGWGQSSLARDLNNLGGIKCSTRAKRCSRGYSHYDSPGHYFEDKAWMVRHNYVDKGLDTMIKLLGTYAPSNDGNNHPDYIRNMAFNIYTRLDGRIVTDVDSGATLSPGSYDPSNPRMSDAEAELFQQALTESTRVGMANIGKESALESPYIRYTLGVISEKTYKILNTLSYIVVALVFAYMAVMVATYALYVKGKVGYEKASKIVGKKAADTYGDTKGILYIVGRMFLGTFIVFIMISRLHILMYAQFYKFVEDIMAVF